MAKIHLIFILYLTVYIFYTYYLSPEPHGTEKRSPCNCNCDTLSTAPDRSQEMLIQGSYF